MREGEPDDFAVGGVSEYSKNKTEERKVKRVGGARSGSGSASASSSCWPSSSYSPGAQALVVARLLPFRGWRQASGNSSLLSPSL